MTTIIPLITMKQGEGKIIHPTIDTPALAKDDLTTYTFSWRMWSVLTGTVLEKTIGTGITLLNQTTNKGELTITIDPADTLALAPITYEHQLYMTFGSDKQIMLKGYIQIGSNRPGVPA